MATCFPAPETLIKYNCNNSEEKDVEEKDPINIELTEQKANPEIMKILLTLNDQMYKKMTRKVLLWLTSLIACKNKLMRKIFQKSNWMIV